MNMIGKFGQLIMQYQHPIQISLIALLVLLVIIFLIRAGLNAKKKKELLVQINQAVAEINTTVTSLNEKKAETEVVYIDNRIPQAPSYPAQPVQEKTPDAEVPAEEPDAETEAETETDVISKAEEATEPSEKAPVVNKFFERDCAVSKSGRIYSIEELQKQIKE